MRIPPSSLKTEFYRPISLRAAVQDDNDNNEYLEGESDEYLS